MASTDDIFKNIKESASKLTKVCENVTKNAVSAVETKTKEAKIRYSMHEIKDRIQSNYAAIGECVYNSFKNKNHSEDFSVIFGKLDALNEELEELSRRLYEECDLQICPDCGAANGLENIKTDHDFPKIKCDDTNITKEYYVLFVITSIVILFWLFVNSVLWRLFIHKEGFLFGLIYNSFMIAIIDMFLSPIIKQYKTIIL
mgnify:CR=1 FL=1